MHLHHILRESTSFVGAYNRGCTHSLAGVHLAHKVICLEHTVHTQREAQRYAHRQALGHRDHDKRYRYHKIIQQRRHHTHRREGFFGKEQFRGEQQKAYSRSRITKLAYNIGKTL